MREKITLTCEVCKQRNYDTMKSKKNNPDKDLAVIDPSYNLYKNYGETTFGKLEAEKYQNTPVSPNCRTSTLSVDRKSVV